MSVAGQGAQLARANGWIDGQGRPVGSIDLAVQEHGVAAEIRHALGVAGKDFQSAHLVPSSAMRGITGYSRSGADTMLLEASLHRALDQHWKDWAMGQRRSGRTTCTVSELRRVMNAAIDQTPNLSPRTKGALSWRLELELFRDLGLKPEDTLELPYPNIK
jgi:hypothetical protein